MGRMFGWTTVFDSDISNWDVSSVTDMSGMFRWASAFSSDIVKWDVASVTSMDKMFFHAVRFNRNLCGAEWVNSKASKQNMFKESSGSISRAVCGTTTITFLSTAEPKGVFSTHDCHRNSGFMCAKYVPLNLALLK